VNPVASGIIGLIAGALVCLAWNFRWRRLRPVGRHLGAWRQRDWGSSCWTVRGGTSTTAARGTATRLGDRLVLRDAGSWFAAHRRRTLGRLRVHSQLVFNLLIDWGSDSVSPRNRARRLDIPEMGSLAIRNSPQIGCHGCGVTDAGALAQVSPFPSLPSPGGILTPFLARELSSLHQLARAGCLEHPRSAELRPLLGMAHAVNYDVYKSMMRSKPRRPSTPRTSGRS